MIPANSSAVVLGMWIVGAMRPRTALQWSLAVGGCMSQPKEGVQIVSSEFVGADFFVRGGSLKEFLCVCKNGKAGDKVAGSKMG